MCSNHRTNERILFWHAFCMSVGEYVLTDKIRNKKKLCAICNSSTSFCSSKKEKKNHVRRKKYTMFSAYQFSAPCFIRLSIFRFNLTKLASSYVYQCFQLSRVVFFVPEIQILAEYTYNRIYSRIGMQ